MKNWKGFVSLVALIACLPIMAFVIPVEFIQGLTDLQFLAVAFLPMMAIAGAGILVQRI